MSVRCSVTQNKELFGTPVQLPLSFSCHHTLYLALEAETQNDKAAIRSLELCAAPDRQLFGAMQPQRARAHWRD